MQLGVLEPPVYGFAITIEQTPKQKLLSTLTLSPGIERQSLYNQSVRHSLQEMERDITSRLCKVITFPTPAYPSQAIGAEANEPLRFSLPIPFPCEKFEHTLTNFSVSHYHSIIGTSSPSSTHLDEHSWTPSILSFCGKLCYSCHGWPPRSC